MQEIVVEFTSIGDRAMGVATFDVNEVGVLDLSSEVTVNILE
jgi:hypothetical protein